MFRYLVYVFLLLITASCGYNFSHYEADLKSKTPVYVPYVEGDREGILTHYLVKEITRSSLFKYSNTPNQLELKVKLLDLRDENIGFRYDRKKWGKLTRSLIPTETRLEASAEVTFIKMNTGEILYGPTVISAEVDFDHDYYSSRNGVNTFSLGQLCDIDSAMEAAQTPLYRLLAERIVDYIGVCF